jgi:hypothetical protein
MAESIAQVNAAAGADTFTILVDRVNEMANVITTVAVTVNSHVNGGITTGNGFVEGIFGGRNLVANTIRGGTVETPGLLTITTNVAVTDAAVAVTVGDVVVNTSDITINGVSVSDVSGITKFTFDTETTATQLIHTYSKLDYRGSEYVVTVEDQNDNAHQISKILTIHDTGNSYATEYGVVWTNTNLGIYTSNADATEVRLYFTPTPANTHVSGSVTLIGV